MTSVMIKSAVERCSARLAHLSKAEHSGIPSASTPDTLHRLYIKLAPKQSDTRGVLCSSGTRAASKSSQAGPVLQG